MLINNKFSPYHEYDHGLDSEDIIQMETDIILKDRNGNIIEVKVPRPEYSSEIFSPYHVHEKIILTDNYKKVYNSIVNGRICKKF